MNREWRAIMVLTVEALMDGLSGSDAIKGHVVYGFPYLPTGSLIRTLWPVFLSPIFPPTRNSPVP